LLAFLVTLTEALATLVFARFFFRLTLWLVRNDRIPREHPVEKAARVAGFEIPAGFKPRPQSWQRKRGTPVEILAGTAPAKIASSGEHAGLVPAGAPQEPQK